MPLGLYISVPFCKSKCSFCNFASGVFSRDRMQRFVERVCTDIANAENVAERLCGIFETEVDTIYFGGGTPSTLEPRQLENVFAAVRDTFEVSKNAEITVECAPGTLSEDIVQSLVRSGVNRVSLGVQSFVDEESRSVGRLHNRAITLTDIDRLREAGISNINVDLIAGLPHQTHESWNESLEQAIATGVPHLSVYMLEVDDDSRLGRELIAGGTRYHAHHVPDEDLAAEFYTTACERLEAGGIAQYEISNFARPGFESKHNLKYWTRQPYFGFGLDAHSMLRKPESHPEDPLSVAAVRFSTTDDLETFLSTVPLGVGVGGRDALRTAGETPALRLQASTHTSNSVTSAESLEEEFFLGLRLNRGIDLDEVGVRTGLEIPPECVQAVEDSVKDALLVRDGNRVKLTSRGRLLSNEVFARFIGEKAAAV